MKINAQAMKFVTGDFLRDALYREDYVLLLDCRSNDEYRMGHISGSHNIVLPQLMMRRLKANKLPLKSLVPPNFSQGKEAFLSKCTSYQVVLYDQVSSDINNNESSMLTLLYSRMEDEGCSVALLKGGYKMFEDQHPDFCSTLHSPTSSDNDDDTSGNEVKSGGRLSPISPLSDLAPSILGLGTLRISCDHKEIDNVDLQKCDNHQHHVCPRHDGVNDSDESQNINFPKCLTRIKNKPAPIALSTCCCPRKAETPEASFPSPCGYVNYAGPAEILPGLFLGCAKDAASQETLGRCGITHILNVTPNLPNVFEADGTYHYKQIPITDHWSQNLSQFFPDAISFIDEARSKNCGVLVHCLAGISRSVTVTVAYLMQTRKWSLNDAYDFVKQRKSNVSPNFNFMGQLLDFEKTLGVGDYSSTEESSVSSASSGGSTPPTLFFTSPPPPTPTLTLPVRSSKERGLEQRTAYILPTTVA